MPKLTTKQRRNRIRELVEDFGSWNFDKTKLSNDFGVSRKTIYDDINVILKETNSEDLEEIRLNIRSSLKFSIRLAQKIAVDNSNNPEMVLKALNTIAKIAESFGKLIPMQQEEQNQKLTINDILKVAEEAKLRRASEQKTIN